MTTVTATSSCPSKSGATLPLAIRESQPASTTDPVTVASGFFSAIYGEAEGHFCVWKPKPARSRFFENSPNGRLSAAKYAVSRSRTHDVYMSCGLLPPTLPQWARGAADDVIGISCLWADIDIAGPGHTATNLPANQTTAITILNNITPSPSIIVHSGGGLHVYWLLSPWRFVDQADRARAAQLSKAWQDHVRAEFGKHGHQLDSCGDLARILRVPGTFNHKNNAKAPVRIIHPC